MSDSISSGFPFPGMEDSGELDISAIFGSAPANDINPFDALAEQAESPAAPPEQPQAEVPAVPAVTPEPTVAPTTQTKAGEQSAPQTKTQSTIPAAEPVNLISAAIDQQETQAAQTAAKSLFEKAPIFSAEATRMRSLTVP